MTSPTDTTSRRDDLAGMFGPNVEPDAPAPLLERDHVKAGVVVLHKRTDSVTTKNGRSLKHVFAVVNAPKGTPWFSLWGSANLNSQLNKLKAGQVVFLRYLGQNENPDGSPGAHMWNVQGTTASASQLRAVLDKPERAAAIRDFSTLLERTLQAEREKRDANRQASSPAGPPHDDDDIPF